MREVAGELQHVQPLIYRSSTAIIIFYGFLSNVDELAKRLEAEGSVGLPFGRTAAAKAKLYTGQSQHHSEAAEALLELYLHTRANDLLIMLSELQVRFCCLAPHSACLQAGEAFLLVQTACLVPEDVSTTCD